MSGDFLKRHGTLKMHSIDHYIYFSWKCNYCSKVLVGSYSELLVNAKRHLEMKHSVTEMKA